MKCIESMKLAARRFSVPVSAAVVSLASAGVAFADGEPLINFEDLTTTVQTDVTTAAETGTEKRRAANFIDSIHFMTESSAEKDSLDQSNTQFPML